MAQTKDDFDDMLAELRTADLTTLVARTRQHHHLVILKQCHYTSSIPSSTSSSTPTRALSSSCMSLPNVFLVVARVCPA
jgi:hypothetical protein